MQLADETPCSANINALVTMNIAFLKLDRVSDEIIRTFLVKYEKYDMNLEARSGQVFCKVFTEDFRPVALKYCIY